MIVSWCDQDGGGVYPLQFEVKIPGKVSKIVVKRPSVGLG